MALVLNRGLKILWFSTAQVSPLSMTLSGSGNSRTVTLQALSNQVYRINLWLSDQEDHPEEVTGTPPTPPGGGQGSVEWKVLTDATGAASITIQNTVARTWYLFAEICGRVSDGLEVTFI